MASGGIAAGVGAMAMDPGVQAEPEHTVDHIDLFVGMKERWEQLDNRDSLIKNKKTRLVNR